jgi:perosamine synthetase
MPFEPLEPGAPTEAGVVPLSVPQIAGREWEYVRDCLDTGWVSSVGSYVDRFERELAARVGARAAVATASGTAALHVALVLAGVQPDDEVVVPALTFVAPANAVRYVGAWPAFVDVDSAYWQMDPEALIGFLRNDCRRDGAAWINRHTGRPVRAVLPVHLLGHPCDITAIRGIATEAGLALIEDATESLGATVGGAPVGQGARLACFSFNGNKLLTTGGGGMLVTDDEALARRGRYLTTQAKDDPLEFVHGAVGFNYRLTNVQAAIGCAQLEQLDGFLARKRRTAERYTAALGELPGVMPMREPPWGTSAFWLYTIRLDPLLTAYDSRSLMRILEREGIQSRPLWQPLHQSPAHHGSFAAACPVAEQVQREALSLPSSTGLTDEAQDRVIATVRVALGALATAARR